MQEISRSFPVSVVSVTDSVVSVSVLYRDPFFFEQKKMTFATKTILGLVA